MLTKLLIISTSLFLIAKNGNTQSISPITTNDYCANVTTTFTVTLPGTGYLNLNPFGTVISGEPSAIPVATSGATNITQNGCVTTFNFTGYFIDVNAAQTFRVTYDLNGQSGQNDFTYRKIKSFFYSDPASQPLPTPVSITAQRCQSQNFNISFSNVQYANPWVTPKLVYGTVTTYEYLLPTGWVLNSTTSTGSNWISGSNNVTVTSDLSHGDQSSIQVRPVNACASNLIKGPAGLVAISRPAPALTITPVTQDVICSGTAQFTINGMPAGSSVQWGVSNTSEAAIASGGTSSTVTISRTGTANTVITLTATVTHCTFTYTATHDISLGVPPPSPIHVILVDPALGKIQVDSDPALPAAALGYKWYKDGVWAIPWSSYHGNFAQIPITRDLCDVGYGITVTSTNACGVSAATYKGVYVPPCADSYTVAPNPATNSVNVSTSQSKIATNTNATFDKIKIYDLQGNMKKYKQYNKVAQATINISDLISGTYIIEITNGAYQEKQQLIIQK
jgi:hypothetical protein